MYSARCVRADRSRDRHGPCARDRVSPVPAPTSRLSPCLRPFRCRYSAIPGCLTRKRMQRDGPGFSLHGYRKPSIALEGQGLQFNGAPRPLVRSRLPQIALHRTLIGHQPNRRDSRSTLQRCTSTPQPRHPLPPGARAPRHRNAASSGASSPARWELSRAP